MPGKHNFTVLYVEDEENDVLLLQHAWREALIDQPLDVVKNGREALNYLARTEHINEQPESQICRLVLLDLNLPILSGFEVLTWLRQHQSLKRMPVVILTSSNQNQDIQLAYELGANAFLVKPSNLDMLLELVRALKKFWLQQNTFPRSEP